MNEVSKINRMRNRPVCNIVMGELLADAEALIAACLECVSLDDIARQTQPNPLHPQQGAYHHV
jgi:hypothetical protein